MRILGITTSSNNCSVAITEDNCLIKELNINNAKTHSETLMPLIDSLLKETNLNLSDIDYLACDIGPGSFTGIRIGVSTIKAISETKKIPICPISSLEGLAYNTNLQTDLIVSLIDARNNQAYCGVFNKDYTVNIEFFADSILNIIEILKQKKQSITFVGNASLLHSDIIKENFENCYIENNNILSASSICSAAFSKIKENKIISSDELVPLYLRKSQAERMQENGGN